MLGGRVPAAARRAPVGRDRRARVAEPAGDGAVQQHARPAVGGGLVVVGSNGGHYYAFDAATGAPRWDYAADGIVHLAAPLIAGGRVYMAGGDDSDRVHAVDAATGAAVPGWPIEPAGARCPTSPGRGVDASARSRRSRRPAAVRAPDAARRRDGHRRRRRAGPVPVARAGGRARPATGAVAWQVPLGRAVIDDPNDVPKFFVCPTPAAFASDGGTPLLAAASSLDARGGRARRRRAAASARDLSMAGAALASPVLANGRLITVADERHHRGAALDA